MTKYTLFIPLKEGDVVITEANELTVLEPRVVSAMTTYGACVVAENYGTPEEVRTHEGYVENGKSGLREVTTSGN